MPQQEAATDEGEMGLWREEVLTVLLGIVQGSVRGDMSKPSLQTLILMPVSMMASFFF